MIMPSQGGAEAQEMQVDDFGGGRETVDRATTLLIRSLIPMDMARGDRAAL